MCWFTQIKDLGAPVHPRKKLFWSRDSNRVLTTREQCRSADGQSKLDGSNVCSNVRPIHSNSGPALSLNPTLTNKWSSFKFHRIFIHSQGMLNECMPCHSQHTCKMQLSIDGMGYVIHHHNQNLELIKQITDK